MTNYWFVSAADVLYQTSENLGIKCLEVRDVTAR